MSKSPTTTTAIHIIAVPYPGRGHVNPMLIISRLLAVRLPSPAAVTVVLTDEWLSLIGGHTAAPPGVHFRTLPNVIPSENGREADFAGFLEAVYTKMEGPFERLMNELETPATAMIADTFLPWAVDVGRRRGLPVCSLYTMSARGFSLLLNYERLPRVEGPCNNFLLESDARLSGWSRGSNHEVVCSILIRRGCRLRLFG